jgi:hypothetical protein
MTIPIYGILPSGSIADTYEQGCGGNTLIAPGLFYPHFGVVCSFCYKVLECMEQRSSCCGQPTDRCNYSELGCCCCCCLQYVVYLQHLCWSEEFVTRNRHLHHSDSHYYYYPECRTDVIVRIQPKRLQRPPWIYFLVVDVDNVN